MERYGYIRVSGKDQNPERQFLAMQVQWEQILCTIFGLHEAMVKCTEESEYIANLGKVEKQEDKRNDTFRTGWKIILSIVVTTP